MKGTIERGREEGWTDGWTDRRTDVGEEKFIVKLSLITVLSKLSGNNC